jgi:hypothetical protein
MHSKIRWDLHKLVVYIYKEKKQLVIITPVGVLWGCTLFLLVFTCYYSAILMFYCMVCWIDMHSIF